MSNGCLKIEKCLIPDTLIHKTKNGFQIIGIRFSVKLSELFSFFFSVFSSFFGIFCCVFCVFFSLFSSIFSFFGFLFRSFGSRYAFQSVQRSFTSCIALVGRQVFQCFFGLFERFLHHVFGCGIYVFSCFGKCFFVLVTNGRRR